MSSRESSLPPGDGYSELSAARYVPPLDLAMGSGDPPMRREKNPIGYVVRNPVPTSDSAPTQSAGHPKLPEEDSDTLPPLLSLGDLMLDVPPWLFSAALHMLAVIVLGLLIIAPKHTDELLLRFDALDSLVDDIAGSDLDVPLDMSQEELDSALTPQSLPEIDDPLVTPPVVVESPIQSEQLENVVSPIRMALTGREAGMQQSLLNAYGGTGATQQSVLEALRWLARNQGKDGLWSMRGSYSDGAPRENHEAATALALLAFQGKGYTPDGDPQEPFTKIVARAWTSLLKKQDENGNFFHEGRFNGQLYTHAICTIAICELYGMTNNSLYRDPAQRAIDYCVKVQDSSGGWRYDPGVGSDLSVTGWFVMALQSARMAGLDVPKPTLDHVSQFLESVSRESGSQYAYLPADAPTLSMSAEGLLCRQYLGWAHSDGRLQRGADFLIENLPSWEDTQRNVYYWYYATQVCHHMEGSRWREWNSVMRELLPRHQVQKGRERGSWDPGGDRWGSAGGRLFVTCLSTYILEVYYRHLPIYRTELLDGKL